MCKDRKYRKPTLRIWKVTWHHLDVYGARLAVATIAIPTQDLHSFLTSPCLLSARSVVDSTS